MRARRALTAVFLSHPPQESLCRQPRQRNPPDAAASERRGGPAVGVPGRGTAPAGPGPATTAVAQASRRPRARAQDQAVPLSLAEAAGECRDPGADFVGDGAGQGVPVRGESDADRPLGDHLEAVITGDDVDENWQLKDPEVTLRSNLAQIRSRVGPAGRE